MINYQNLIEKMVVQEGEHMLFNGHQTMHDALCDLSNEFKDQDVGYRIMASTVAYNVVVHKISAKALKEIPQPCGHQIASLYGVAVDAATMRNDHFDYYHCEVDESSDSIEVSDDFEEYVGHLSICEVREAYPKLSFTSAVQAALVDQGLVERHDVLEFKYV